MTTLRSYGDQLLDDFERQLAAARVKPETEVVHRLRVLIKKIRALLVFLAEYNQTFDEKKAVKKVKKIFKPAGYLRDLQLQRKLLKKYRKNAQEAVSLFLKKNKGEKDAAEADLQTALDKFGTDQMIQLRAQWQQAVAGIEEEKLEKLCEDFAQRKLTAIASLSLGTPEDEQLHQIRKYLKEVLYVQQILDATEHGFTLSPATMEKLKNLQEEFGAWHDLQVLFDRLLQTSWDKTAPQDLLHAVEADKIYSEVTIIRHLEADLEVFLAESGFLS